MPKYSNSNIIFLNKSIYETIEAHLSELAVSGRLFIVSTDKILKLTGFRSILKKFEKTGNCFIYNLKEDGEKCKSLTNANLILKKLASLNYSKNDILTGIGGGTVTDLSGFCAAIYKRGMRLNLIPTTLLGMIDAAIGGKTAVNSGKIKNLAGAFYNPEKIIIIPDFLKTLPKSEMANGMFEALKYGLLFSPALTQIIIEKNFDFTIYSQKSKNAFIKIIKECVNYKEKIINIDYSDKGLRRLLNAGHTIGHAIESASKNEINHGLAVGMGLFLETALGEKINIIKPANAGAISDIIMKFFEKSGYLNLFEKWITGSNMCNLKKYIVNDKKAQCKNSGKIAKKDKAGTNSVLLNCDLIINMPFILKIGLAALHKVSFTNELAPFLNAKKLPSPGKIK